MSGGESILGCRDFQVLVIWVFYFFARQILLVIFLTDTNFISSYFVFCWVFFQLTSMLITSVLNLFG